jgi:hypothetical protein
MSLMDPQDQKFGHKAAQELSDEPPRDEPRVGRKADEP